MTANLADYGSVETALLVHWQYQVPIYGSVENLYVSDSYRPIDYDGNTYLPLRQFIQIDVSKSEIRTAGDTVSITWSGIQATGTDNATVQLLQNKGLCRVKGSKIIIRRAFFEPTTGVLLPLTVNPVGRFYGFVKNFNIADTEDAVTGIGSTQVIFEVADFKSFLATKVSGRTTSYPDKTDLGDLAFYRTASIKGKSFEWGKK